MFSYKTAEKNHEPLGRYLRPPFNAIKAVATTFIYLCLSRDLGGGGGAIKHKVSSPHRVFTLVGPDPNCLSQNFKCLTESAVEAHEKKGQHQNINTIPDIRFI